MPYQLADQMYRSHADWRTNKRGVTYAGQIDLRTIEPATAGPFEKENVWPHQPLGTTWAHTYVQSEGRAVLLPAPQLSYPPLSVRTS